MLGHPIVGDARYWPRELPCHGDDGLFLCANAIELAHPASGEWLRVSAREPHNFATFCAAGAQ